MRRQLGPGLLSARRIAFVCAVAMTLPPNSAKAEATVAELAAGYHACSGLALATMLGPSDAQACADIYTRLKLAVLGGPDFETFKALPPERRAAFNRAAYEALLNWRRSQPPASSKPPQAW